MKHLPDPSRIVLVCSLVALVWSVAACPKQHRRGDDGAEDDGRPSSSVEKKGDPRFPSAGDGEERHGFWVEEPLRTEPVSPTALANAVADQLPELRRKCCGDDGEGCRGYEGRMLLETAVTPDGSVDSVAIGETSLYDRDFRGCVLDWARGWELPSTDMNDNQTVYVPIRAKFHDDDSDPE